MTSEVIHPLSEAKSQKGFIHSIIHWILLLVLFSILISTLTIAQIPITIHQASGIGSRVSNMRHKLHPLLHSFDQINSTGNPSHISKNDYRLLPVFKDENNHEYFDVIINTNYIDRLRSEGFQINSEYPGFATARLKADQILHAASLNYVDYVSSTEIYFPTNDIACAITGAHLVNNGSLYGIPYKGKDVIICIIDTGIDWNHGDFKNPDDTSKTRILYIWDQTIVKKENENTPQDRNSIYYSGLNYGVEYSKEQIENEIDGTPVGFVRAKDTNGHGTHVAGTAAGNGNSLKSSANKYAGIAPEADIVIVKAGNNSFSAGNVINALTYAKKIAGELDKPVVVNLSLGSHLNAHDGTRNLDKAIDYFTGMGRIAVVSAGNEGDDPIHVSGTIKASSSEEIILNIPGYSPNNGINNDFFGFDLWFNTNENISAEITSPRNFNVWQDTSSQSTTCTDDGTIYMYNYVDFNNYDREIYTYIYDNNSTEIPAAGNWKLLITNKTESDVIYHGWLYGSSMCASLTSGDNNYTISSPGTSEDAITVGSFAARWRWHSDNGSCLFNGYPDHSDNISPFSSVGPRRDGLQKPDIIAPGQSIISSKSADSSPNPDFIVNGSKHFKNQGTSMSAPVAAGAAALLLQYNPGLTANQVKSYLTNNADADSYTESVPNSTWGFGKLNIFKSLLALINESGLPGNNKINLQNEILSYDGWNSVNGININANDKLALKFTPSFTGKITGLLFHLYSENKISGSLLTEIWSDSAGYPRSKLGSTISTNPDYFLGYSWNIIDMNNSEIILNEGKDYHAIIYFTNGGTTSFAYNDINSRRSLINIGNGWEMFSDLKIRPIIISDNANTTVNIHSENDISNEYHLENAFPNPFNPTTTIRYSLPFESKVRINIFNSIGQRVTELFSAVQSKGNYNISWNAAQNASGIYFYSLEAEAVSGKENFRDLKKLILIR